ncbi:LPS-assembly protein LptD [Helicobacter monodelphidis]|uniref:LPS-assembly protein LptD n=1 Tax=Helicobacter sp. 15-1451 TaxID=2004995 RepID=UPI0015EBAC2C|nr:LPS assembly protein LptD [Helicobacter sp. 15-1451]
MVNLEASRPSIGHFNKENKKVFEFLADSMSNEGELLKGEGNVVLLTSDFYIVAHQATYNTQKKIIEVRGSVLVFKGETLYMKADKVRFELDEQYSILEPFYMHDAESGLWVSAQKAILERQQYNVQGSTLSACSLEMPIWSISFKEGTYNQEESWIRLWHARFFLFDYPVFYSPYFSFSTNRSRQSGFLFPKVGHSKDDGIIYHQPFYIAVDSQWDATVTSQYRQHRGFGGLAELRFSDHRNSVATLRAGYFRNQQSYQDTFDLANKASYGYQARYVRSGLFSEFFKLVKEDGLYIDWTELNDIEYLRIQKEGEGDVDIYDKLLTSRINYFLKGENNYVGIYSKYYIDLSLTNNDTTFQTLPTIQYHSHTSPLLWDKLSYSIDYKLHNYWRKEGYTTTQNELTIPISLTQPLLNDYIMLKLSTALYATYANHSNITPQLNDFLFFSNYYTFAVYSDLIKPYKSFNHSLHLETEYTLPGIKERKGDVVPSLQLPGDQNKVTFSVSQYFYSPSKLEPFLYHRVTQPFYRNHQYENIVGDFENELRWFLSENWSISSSIFYSFSKHRIAELSHDLSYQTPETSLYVGHFLRKKGMRYLENTYDLAEADFIHFAINKNLGYFGVFGSLGYDYKEHYFRTWNVGLQKSVRCFSYRVRLANEMRPILTTSGIQPQENRYILFELQFDPVGAVSIKL